MLQKSQATTTTPSSKFGDLSERPPRIRAKFLPRKLVLFPEDEIVLKKIRMKGLCVKLISELETEQLDEDLFFSLNKHKYLKGKSIKSLHKIDLISFSSLHWLDKVKHAKNLEGVSIEVGMEDLKRVNGFADIHGVIKYIIQCLKKLPKNIREIKLYMEGLSVKKKDMNQIYKILAGFRNLESYGRLFGFVTPEKYVEEEYRLIKKYVPRFSKLKGFDYDYWRYDKTCWDDDQMMEVADYTAIDQADFQKMVTYINPCPWITEIGINIVGEFLKSFPAFEQNLEAEDSEDEDGDDGKKDGGEGKEDDWEDEEEDEKADSDDDEDDEDDEDDDDDNEGEDDNDGLNQPNADIQAIENASEEEKASIMKEEIMPFYKFDLFPNLKKLDFQIFDDCLYPLGPFVVDAFASLKNLEYLEVTLEGRPANTKFVFEGIEKIPALLKSFSLETVFLKNQDWKLLGEFFDKQTELESVSLEISEHRGSRTRYYRQNEHFQNIYRFLENKPKLQYLTLGSEYCPIESLSEALGNLKIVNQLKLLHIQAMDDTSTSSKTSLERTQGLCDFLRRQKESLIYLKLSLPFLVDIAVLEHITQAISDLEGIKELELYVNDIDLGERKRFIVFFEKTLMKDNPAKFKKTRKCFYPCVTKMLEKLKKVDDLTIYFGANSDQQKFLEEYIEMLSVLPKMKSLINVEVNVPFHYTPDWMVTKMKKIFMDMKEISALIVDTDDLDDDDIVEGIEETVEVVNKRQYLRCDFMF